MLEGTDPTDIDGCRRLMRQITVNSGARAGVEMALHDAVAQSAGIPLFEFYGGRSRPAVPTIWHVSGGDPASNAEEAARAVHEDGFRLVKVKVGGDVDVDIAKMWAVREAVGPDVMLIPDANQGWDPDSSIRFCQAVAGAHPAFLEQPVLRNDVAGMARVNAGPVRVAADEGVFDVTDLRTHLVLAAPNLMYGAGTCPYYLAGDIVAEPLQVEAGMLHPPAGPGLGLHLDPDLVKRYRLDV